MYVCHVASRGVVSRNLCLTSWDVQIGYEAVFVYVIHADVLVKSYILKH